jgi:hypothetical protein
MTRILSWLFPYRLPVLVKPLKNPVPWRPLYVGLHIAGARSKSALS